MVTGQILRSKTEAEVSSQRGELGIRYSTHFGRPSRCRTYSRMPLRTITEQPILRRLTFLSE
jgi:hypothetical protein